MFLFDRTPTGWVERDEIVVGISSGLPRALALHGDRLALFEPAGELIWLYEQNAAGVWSVISFVGASGFRSLALADEGLFFVYGGGQVFVYGEDQGFWGYQGELSTSSGPITDALAADAVNDRAVFSTSTGAVVFERDPSSSTGWSELATLGPYAAPAGEVAIWGDTVLVGDTNLLVGDELIDFGAAHLHQEDAGWAKTQTLVANGYSVAYGASVDVGPNHLLALDPGAAEIGEQAQLYRRVSMTGPDAWVLAGQVGTNPVSDTTQVRLGGKQVLVGSPDWSVLAPTGMVQVFELRDVQNLPGSSWVPASSAGAPSLSGR